MALRLRPLRDDERPAYIEHGRAPYERELVAQAGLTPAAAQQKTATDWSRLFPDGSVPPGNELYAIEDDGSGGTGRRPVVRRARERCRRDRALRLLDRDRP